MNPSPFFVFKIPREINTFESHLITSSCHAVSMLQVRRTKKRNKGEGGGGGGDTASLLLLLLF